MELSLLKNKKNPFATKGVIKILNFRIQAEESSSRLYQGMSLWLNDNGFMGAAATWLKDSEDEMAHALWAKTYLLDMGIQPTLPALKMPPQTFGGLPEIIRKSYEHEVLVTEQVNSLAIEGQKTGDHLLYQLAIKYMEEQQEELGRLQTLLDKLDAFGEDKIAMRLLDNELAG
jgi:ferritin